jgi:hypothetical protein
MSGQGSPAVATAKPVSVASLHPEPTLLTPEQRLTFAAIADAFLAPLTDEAEIRAILDECATLPHFVEAGVARADIDRFLRMSASDLPWVVQSVESVVQRHAPADAASELGLLLSIMGSPWGMLGLTASPSLAKPFHALESADRQRVLVGMCNSVLAPKRKAFQVRLVILRRAAWRRRRGDSVVLVSSESPTSLAGFDGESPPNMTPHRPPCLRFPSPTIA